RDLFAALLPVGGGLHGLAVVEDEQLGKVGIRVGLGLVVVGVAGLADVIGGDAGLHGGDAEDLHLALALGGGGGGLRGAIGGGGKAGRRCRGCLRGWSRCSRGRLRPSEPDNNEKGDHEDRSDQRQSKSGWNMGGAARRAG